MYRDGTVYMKNGGNEVCEANKDVFPLRWAAYETIDSGLAIREKSDVWSFGIFMWELFYLGDAMPYADINGKVSSCFFKLKI